jgi:hypothetical protein
MSSRQVKLQGSQGEVKSVGQAQGSRGHVFLQGSQGQVKL